MILAFNFFIKRILILSMILLSIPSYCMAPKVDWNQAIDRAVKRYGLPVEPQLKSYFSKKAVSYPPSDIALLAFKAERTVELWAKDQNQNWKHILNYPLTGYSGQLGPKLRSNDGQIPEGIYRLVNFNPFSSMHLSMMINYPNNYDQEKGSQDGRKNLGNNIFIHGKDLSVGCLAIGDRAIDQLFILARRVGLSHVQVIIAPNDLRNNKPSTIIADQPKWLPELYGQITDSLKPFNKKKDTV